MGLPTTRTPNYPYSLTSNNVPKAPEMPQNIEKRPKTSENVRKGLKNAKILENVQNGKKLDFFSSEEHAAPIFSRGRGPQWRPWPLPRRGRRRGRGLGRGQKTKLTCTGGGKRR